MDEKMQSIAMILLEKTEKRMRKETTLSKKTLKMVSISEKLFSAIKTWGNFS